MASELRAKLAQSMLTIAPRIISKPLAILPFQLKANIIARMLKLILVDQQRDGELTALEGHAIGVNVSDLKLTFEVMFSNDCWQVIPLCSPAVTFTAPSDALLLVAAGKEDPDTLFFQRKLNIEGDTELGLEVKNLMLSIEFDALPSPVRFTIEKLAKLLMALQQTTEPA